MQPTMCQRLAAALLIGALPAFLSSATVAQVTIASLEPMGTTLNNKRALKFRYHVDAAANDGFRDLHVKVAHTNDPGGRNGGDPDPGNYGDYAMPSGWAAHQVTQRTNGDGSIDHFVTFTGPATSGNNLAFEFKHIGNAKSDKAAVTATNNAALVPNGNPVTVPGGNEIVTASGQGPFGPTALLVPDSQNFFNSGTSSLAWPTAAAGGCVQWCYDSTHFTNAGIAGPVTISRLRFRAADGVRGIGGQTWSGVVVQLGSAALDYSALSSTYALNRGIMGAASSPFSITHGAPSGAVPNDYYVDIDLAAVGAAFTYDPTSGNDLLLDFRFPAGPVPATNIVPQATSTTITQRARRCAGTLTGPGTLSSFAAVILMDFTSTDPGYTSSNGAHAESIGAGCGVNAQSFYQLFGREPFSLRGPGRSLLLTPDNPAAPTYYSVSSGTTAVDTSANALGTGPANITDDGVISHTPGFTFRFPGGSTTTFGACTNGYVWLGSNSVGDYSPSVAELLNSTARLAPFWADHHAGRNSMTIPNAGMYISTDLGGGPGNGVTYATWLDVGEYASAVPGLCDNTFQCVLFENGNVEFRYGSFSSWLAAAGAIIGFSRGGTAAALAANPGSRDLSDAAPFSTLAETAADANTSALSLAVSGRPALGVPASLGITHTLANLPASSVMAFVVIDFGTFTPSVPLMLGSHGNCVQTVANPAILASQVLPPSSWTTSPLMLPSGLIPDAATFMGLELFTQGVTLNLDPVSLGISTTSSNTLRLTLGLL